MKSRFSRPASFLPGTGPAQPLFVFGLVVDGRRRPPATGRPGTRRAAAPFRR